MLSAAEPWAQGLHDVRPFIANARIDIVVDVELVSPALDIVETSPQE